MFVSSSIGAMVVASGMLSAAFFRKEGEENSILSFLAIALAPILLSATEFGDANLIGGDVLLGLFVGYFAISFMSKLFDMKERNLVLIGLGYAIVLGVSVALVMAGGTFEQMGGLDAFAGVLVGIAVGSLNNKQRLCFNISVCLYSSA